MATITGTDTPQSADHAHSPQPQLQLTVGLSGVLDGLHRLLHDPVVCRHHEDDDVSDAGSAGSHGGEGGMAGRVQEGDLLP